jgi:DNA replicative helicase MCM subunit Mcm2 (Cdc46/Mcm family)
METLVVNCKDCGKTFSINEKDQLFYQKMGFELPKRCLDCRKKNKIRREQEGK